jgi:hypothetical protein
VDSPDAKSTPGHWIILGAGKEPKKIIKHPKTPKSRSQISAYKVSLFQDQGTFRQETSCDDFTILIQKHSFGIPPHGHGNRPPMKVRVS